MIPNVPTHLRHYVSQFIIQDKNMKNYESCHTHVTNCNESINSITWNIDMMQYQMQYKQHATVHHIGINMDNWRSWYICKFFASRCNEPINAHNIAKVQYHIKYKTVYQCLLILYSLQLFKFIYYQNTYKYIIKYRCTMKWWADILKCICP